MQVYVSFQGDQIVGVSLQRPDGSNWLTADLPTTSIEEIRHNYCLYQGELRAKVPAFFQVQPTAILADGKEPAVISGELYPDSVSWPVPITQITLLVNDLAVPVEVQNHRFQLRLATEQPGAYRLSIQEPFIRHLPITLEAR